MPKYIIKFFKKHFIAIWIAAAALTLVTLGALATYTNQSNKAKKVVATVAKTEMQFSSNYLDTTNPFRTIVINDGDAISVDVRNYSGNSTTWYKSDINYTFTAELTKTDGSSLSESEAAELLGDGGSVIIKTADDEGTESPTPLCTLTATNRSSGDISRCLTFNSSATTSDHFKVYFSSPSSKVCVKITATPNVSYKDLELISAILAVSDKSSVQNNGWTGEFTDPMTNKTPSDYDAYNYAITGNGNSDSATLRWDSSKISINSQYIRDTLHVTTISDIPGRTGWKEITFSLDSTTSSGRYSFQVFKVNGQIPATWNALKGYIEFDDGI